MKRSERAGSLILAGGGNPQQSRPVDRAFAELIPAASLLYVPFAREHQEATARVAEIRETFADSPPDVLDVWAEPGQPPAPLPRYDAIYIDGGNTFRLMATLHRYHQTESLLRFHQDGGAIYGMSAGAILLGASIEIAAHFDANEEKLDDFAGLDLLDGADVWPHYTQSQHDQAATLVRHTRRTILAIPEDGAALIRGENWYGLGAVPTLLVPHASGGMFDIPLVRWPGENATSQSIDT
jgi:dipeptidase E